jgi:MraZ protein
VNEEPIGAANDRKACFLGVFTHKMDPKKRVTIPSKWREMVGQPEELVVIPHATLPCLRLHPMRLMETIAERAAMVSPLEADAAVEEQERQLGARSDLVDWDGQGRIRVRDDHLLHAKLTDEVVLVGAWARIELWSPETWNRHQQSLASSKSGTAE